MCKKEMTAVEFLKAWKRLCKQHQFDCRGCGIAHKKGLAGCKIWVTAHPEEAVAIVQKWAEENPVKTIMSDFFEKYPSAPKLSNGAPETCPSKLGYDDWNGNCVCPKDCIECWSRPLEG